MRQAQAELKQQGLYKGKVDGVLGPKTRQALDAYQKREGLRQTASLDHDTLQRLGLAAEPTANATAATANGTSTPPAPLSPSALRGRLQQEGYSNISDISRNSNNTWSVRAERGNQEVALRVDAQTGRVISQHDLAAAGTQQPAGSSAQPADTGASSNSSGNNTGSSTSTGNTGNSSPNSPNGDNANGNTTSH